MDNLNSCKCASISKIIIIIIFIILIVNVRDSYQQKNDKQKVCKENTLINDQTCYVKVPDNSSVVNIWMQPREPFQKVLFSDLRLINNTFLTLKRNWFTIDSWKNIFINITLMLVNNNTACTAQYILGNEWSEIPSLPLHGCYDPKRIYLTIFGTAKISLTKPVPKKESPEAYILGLPFSTFYVIIGGVASMLTVGLICSIVVFALHRRKVRKFKSESKMQLATNEVIPHECRQFAEGNELSYVNKENINGVLRGRPNISTEEDVYCDVDSNCVDDIEYIDVDPTVAFGPVLIGGHQNEAYGEETCDYSEVDVNVVVDPERYKEHHPNDEHYLHMDSNRTFCFNNETREYFNVDLNVVRNEI